MGKSLNELLRDVSEETSTSSYKPISKMVRCPYCGDLIPTSGYNEDIIHTGCSRTIEQPASISKNYPFQREGTKEKVKDNPLIAAIPYKKHYTKTVADKT